MTIRWNEKLLTGAGLLFPVLLLQPPGHTISVGWSWGSLVGTLLRCLAASQVKKSRLAKHQSVKRHRREREKGEEESREDTFPP